MATASLTVSQRRPGHVLAGSALKGFALEATDGKLGTVSDFLFSDETWRMRWLVVDERAVVFTLGHFQKVQGPGLVLVMPFFQEMVRVISGFRYRDTEPGCDPTITFR
jgi:hypothetical protein